MSMWSCLSTMSDYCAGHGGQIEGGGRQNYGYIVETEHYRYCLRCSPGPGDYQAYLAAFDLRVQRMNMKQKTPAQDCGLEDGIKDQTPGQGITMGGL